MAFQLFWAASEAARALPRACAALLHKAVSDSSGIRNWSPNGLKALFSREVHLRVRSACSGCYPRCGNLSTELLRKSAPCPGLPRILQLLARQRRAGFLSQGSSLSFCSLLLELPRGAHAAAGAHLPPTDSWAFGTCHQPSEQLQPPAPLWSSWKCALARSCFWSSGPWKYSLSNYQQRVNKKKPKPKKTLEFYYLLFATLGILFPLGNNFVSMLSENTSAE